MGTTSDSELPAMAKPVMLENNQMSLAFERQILEKRSVNRPRISCTLVTGFLGSGKTTLVRHILRNKGDLRIAVLVNEFSEIDIDGVILHNSQTHASLGIPAMAMEMMNGCACCILKPDLKRVVKNLTASAGHAFDHLIIETSGVADPGPIAAVLEELGVRLHMIVTLVDAENLLEILSNPVAKCQLSAADIVLINKCDLASLGTIADVEDRVEAQIGGSARVVRCRFSQVPIPLVIDVVEMVTPSPSSLSNDESGFLSHEKVVMHSSLHVVKANQEFVATAVENDDDDDDGDRSRNIDSVSPSGHGRAPPPPPTNAEKRRKKLLAEQINRDLRIHEETGFTSLVFKSEEPISLFAFQDFIRNSVLKTKGLLRAKGILWFLEDRSKRYVFQYSGKRRAEAVCDVAWEGPPGVKVVFIGRDAEALEMLRSSLSLAVLSIPRRRQEKHDDDDDDDDGAWISKEAMEFQAMIASDERFQLFSSSSSLSSRHERITLGVGGGGGGRRGDDDDGGCGQGSMNKDYRRFEGRLVRFGLVGFPLKGISAADLNADLMCSVNASGSLFLTAASSPKHGHVLQLAFGRTRKVEKEKGEEEERKEASFEQWNMISVLASRVIAKATKDICPCRCDYTRSV